MTDQSTQLQQLLSNTAIQEAVKSIGPMPFLGSGWTSATYRPVPVRMRPSSTRLTRAPTSRVTGGPPIPAEEDVTKG